MTWRPGDVIDVPEREAMTLIERAQAEPVDHENAGPAAVETMTSDEPRRPATKRGKRTKSKTTTPSA
ncbi:MAG: hypothetical protein EA379_09520 [Phycisphaerales bacterium]|nr:MAG: hypothetical protein EA379_09520 [Phycisphaerales bacterium]